MFNNKREINVIQTLYFIVILGKVNTFIHIYTYMYRHVIYLYLYDILERERVK